MVKRQIRGRPCDPADLVKLLLRAQVDHRRQTQVGQLGQIRLGQAVQPVRPEQPMPSDATTVEGAVATEITKVETALQVDDALVAGGRGHDSTVAALFVGPVAEG